MDTQIVIYPEVSVCLILFIFFNALKSLKIIKFLSDMTPSSTPETISPLKLLDQVRNKLRVKQYSIRDEHAYVDWIKHRVFYMASAAWPKSRC